jgi:hypothetical protein
MTEGIFASNFIFPELDNDLIDPSTAFLYTSVIQSL